jgi:hypothetical protein
MHKNMNNVQGIKDVYETIRYVLEGMYLPINNFPMWAYRINMKEIIEKSLTVKKTKSMISLFWEISAGSYPLLITVHVSL